MKWITRKGKNQKLELVPPAQQPRFANVVDCRYKNILGEDNKWYILTLTLDKDKGVPVDINEARIEAIETMAETIGRNIVVGNFGAQVADDCDAKEGYYIVEWIGMPYTDQESGELVCDAHYLYPVGRSSRWYTKSLEVAKIELKYVASADVKLENISDVNPLPQRMNKSERNKAKEMNALRISNESFEFLFEEIYSRESLALEEFPELEGSDEDDDDDDDNSGGGSDDDDSGSDVDDDDDCSL